MSTEKDTELENLSLQVSMLHVLVEELEKKLGRQKKAAGVVQDNLFKISKIMDINTKEIKFLQSFLFDHVLDTKALQKINVYGETSDGNQPITKSIKVVLRGFIEKRVRADPEILDKYCFKDLLKKDITLIENLIQLEPKNIALKEKKNIY